MFGGLTGDSRDPSKSNRIDEIKIFQLEVAVVPGCCVVVVVEKLVQIGARGIQVFVQSRGGSIFRYGLDPKVGNHIRNSNLFKIREAIDFVAEPHAAHLRHTGTGIVHGKQEQHCQDGGQCRNLELQRVISQ